MDDAVGEQDDVPWYSDYYSDFFHRLWAVQRMSASLSIVGSVYIVKDILSDPEKRKRVINQVMLCLSASDLLYSFFGPFLAQWPAPKGLAPGAIGSNQSCAAVAFFNGIGFPCSAQYNAALAICYLLMVRYEWSEERLQKRARIWLLVIPFVLSLPMVIASLIWQSNNFSGIICAKSTPHPKECMVIPGMECERGKGFEKFIESGPYTFLLVAVPFVISLPIVMICMILLYLYILKHEQANDRYRFESTMRSRSSSIQVVVKTFSYYIWKFCSRTRNVFCPQHRKLSNQVATQGIFYVWSFLIVSASWMYFSVITSIAGQNGGELPTSEWLLIFTNGFIVPLMGFFNALVYLRPRYIEYIQKNPEKSCAGQRVL